MAENTYRSVLCTGRGGPDRLKVVEQALRDPGPGEARIRTLAVAVCQDDIAARRGNRPFLPRIPFTPGYSFIGTVDAVGAGAAGVRPGDRVAALTRFGAYSEFVWHRADALVAVPETVDPATAAPLVLNYLVAWQCLHRVARLKDGGTALVIGASGGVGTAFLDLARLAGVTVHGLASAGKHAALARFGAIPIDYRNEDFVAVLKAAVPAGVDAVFNGMAQDYFRPAMKVLRRGGMLVHYGAPQGFWQLWWLVAMLLALDALPNGRAVRGYGTHRIGLPAMKSDWKMLFRLLETGKIRPLVAASYPLLEARKANEALETGRVAGNVVLDARRPEIRDGTHRGPSP
ncbi:MAG: medium chain dehydrogenase/reductase family protein [Oricola sp.]